MYGEGNIRNYLTALTAEFESLFSDIESELDSREDSRAFGAMIERRTTDSWEDVCNRTNSEYIPPPGRRTIYDFASRYNNSFLGFDIKTKDLDSHRYSDGGVCAIANLIRFLANEKAIFVVVEFGHHKAQHNALLRKLSYIKLAPFHLLPADIYRIENLGTGQVRLNRTINEAFNEIDWNRHINVFFDIFVDLTIKHYERVGSTAEQRADAMRRFRDAGYNDFRI